MTENTIEVREPLVIIYQSGDGLTCRIYPSESASSHEHYGMIICDLVRHVARAFNVTESEVWDAVDKERDNPTTEVTQAS